MKYTTLPQTDIKVSTICLGTMTWGNQNTEKDAHEQMDYAVDQGINFFDTAELYAVPPSPETQGLTEKYIGTWFKKSKKRNDIFLASKVAARNPGMQYLRPNDIELSLNKKNIRYAIDGSLKRLQIDHIDLYQIHWPDRDTNIFGKRGYQENGTDAGVSIEETLEALKELIDEGKIRYIGLSNETPWGVMQFIKYAEMKKLPRIVSIQNCYSLIIREFEIGLSELCVREGVGFLPYSPLAHGVLTGKYLDGARPKGSRFTITNRNSERYNPPHAQVAIKKYIALAKKHGLDPAQMALAFVNSRPFVTSTIIGATTMEQLKSDIASVDIELSDEVINEIQAIHTEHPNPCT